jgi:hypothetical protein
MNLVFGSVNKMNKGQILDEIDELLSEVNRLRKQLSEAKDVIQYALDMTSDDDAKDVFEDFLGVKEK